MVTLEYDDCVVVGVFAPAPAPSGFEASPALAAFAKWYRRAATGVGAVE